MACVLCRRTVRRSQGSWRTPSVDTGSKRSPPGAHSEEGLWQRAGPDRDTEDRWPHRRGGGSMQDHTGTITGMKRGQIRRDAGPWPSASHQTEKVETPAVEKELEVRLFGGPDEAFLSNPTRQWKTDWNSLPASKGYNALRYLDSLGFP